MSSGAARWEPHSCGRSSADVRIGHSSAAVSTAHAVMRLTAEERRLLRSMPEYAEEVTQVIEATAQKQAKVAQSRGDYTADEASATRRAGGRRLARLRRAHRVELATLDLRRWSSLAEMLAREARPAVRTTAAKAQKRGLGAAALTELSLLSIADTIKIAERILEKRKNSGWRV